MDTDMPLIVIVSIVASFFALLALLAFLDSIKGSTEDTQSSGRGKGQCDAGMSLLDVFLGLIVEIARKGDR